MTPSKDIARLVAIMARLRDPARGCPWDVEQTSPPSRPTPSRRPTRSPTPSRAATWPSSSDELGDLLLRSSTTPAWPRRPGAFAFGDVVEADLRQDDPPPPARLRRREPRQDRRASRPATGSAPRPASANGTAERAGALAGVARRPPGPHPRRQAAEPRRPRRLRLARRRRRCSTRSPRRPPSSVETPRRRRPAARASRRSSATCCSSSPTSPAT